MKSVAEIMEGRRLELRKRDIVKCPKCGESIFEIYSEDGNRIVQLDSKIYDLYSLSEYKICGKVSGYKVHKCKTERQTCLNL